MKTEYTRRKQPHFQHIGATFSVTLLVHDAVPRPLLEKLRSEREARIQEIDLDSLPDKALRKAHLHSEFERQLEELLSRKDQQEHPLCQPVAARALAARVLSYHAQFYNLCAYCIMSNHLHLLLDFSVQVPEDYDGVSEIPEYQNLHTVMGRIKGGAAYEVNKVLKRRGPLWAPGYYDRYIRSPRHFFQAFWYILHNPVKAGLVTYWEDYPFVYGDPARVAAE